MRGGKNKTGYTITEVLIVLAISSAMFLVANSFISGRVSETAFRTGVNEMASRIQDVMDQVSNGQYNDRPVSCTVTGGIVTISDGNVSQGTNRQCSYAGKLFRFTSGQNSYILDTIAGQLTTDSAPNYTGLTPINKFQVTQNVAGGLTPKTSSSATYTFGFLLNPSQSSSGNSDNVWLVNSSYTRIATGLFICFTNGKNTAKISIGDSSSTGMAVKTDFINITGC